MAFYQPLCTPSYGGYFNRNVKMVPDLMPNVAAYLDHFVGVNEMVLDMVPIELNAANHYWKICFIASIVKNPQKAQIYGFWPANLLTH
jgi:hypothetical protein